LLLLLLPINFLMKQINNLILFFQFYFMLVYEFVNYPLQLPLVELVELSLLIVCSL